MKTATFIFSLLFFASSQLASANNDKVAKEQKTSPATELMSVSSLSANWADQQKAPATPKQKEITKVTYSHQATAMIARSLKEQASN